MNRHIDVHLRLSFRHVQRYDRRRGATIARLDVMKGGDVLRGWFGVAHCSRRDEFHKTVGRRLALERLLDTIIDDADAYDLVRARLDAERVNIDARVAATANT